MLAQPAFAAFLAPLYRPGWVVSAKKPFAAPHAMLAYLIALHPPYRHPQSATDFHRRDRGLFHVEGADS
jgi:hypothetical protein